MASHHLRPVVSYGFSSNIGRSKLMLRLPSLRGTLGRLGGDPIDELAEALRRSNKHAGESQKKYFRKRFAFERISGAL